MAIFEQYQYGVHVRKSYQLCTTVEKRIYLGKWLIGMKNSVIIIEMNADIGEHEGEFLKDVNNHESIIQTFGFIPNPNNLSIFIQEYAVKGDLSGYLLDAETGFTQVALLEMFKQIANAMSYVASQRIVHGDLGCRNVLIFNVDTNNPTKTRVKLTDFGLARWMDRPSINDNNKVIPIRFCAPEILRNNCHKNYSEKSDVYSFAVFMWEALCNSEFPYSSESEDDSVRRKKLNDERLPKPRDCDRQLWSLMNRCWYDNANQRPDFTEIKEKLSNITISETLPTERENLDYDYELDVDVRIVRKVNEGSPAIYEAECFKDDQGPIIIIEKTGTPSEDEQLFYTTLNKKKHIVHTYGYVENYRGTTMILQERAPFGSLQSLLRSGQFRPTLAVLLEIFTQISEVMADIVGAGLVHGDLRCENVLVFEMHPTDPKQNLVKLCNFSLAHKNDPTIVDNRRLNIPVRYCAPEILRSVGRSNYSEYSDVYSMGVLMWQALSDGKLPYESIKTIGEIRQQRLNKVELHKPLSCPREIWSIMKNFWFNEPQVRYEFQLLKAQLSRINNVSSMEICRYRLNKDVKQNELLNFGNGRFYDAEWIERTDQPICLLTLSETAEYEAELYLELKIHPHITHTFGLVIHNEPSIMLVQERAPHGDLQGLIQHENFSPSIAVLVTIMSQIIEGMVHITNNGIVHGDLCCSNILVFKKNESEPLENLVKITNFSASRPKDQNDLENSELFDTYSMGLLMLELLSKGSLTHDNTDNNQELSRPVGCPELLWIIIQSCLVKNACLRSDFKYLKEAFSKDHIRLIPSIHCDLCNTMISENKIESHRQTCRPEPQTVLCSICDQQILLDQIEIHQLSCKKPKQSFLRRILSYFSFSKSK